MISLRREWDAVGAARLAVLVRAQVAVDAGALTVKQVAQVFEVSEATWYRWVQSLGLRELAAECVAGVDAALRAAGATDETTLADVRADPDLALALGTRGVWSR